MISYSCNIWDFIGNVDAICITTNGHVTSSGCAVMGRGIALEASNRYPDIKKVLGKKLTKDGNHVTLLTEERGTHVLSFPVKRASFDLTKEEGFPGMVRGMTPSTFVPGWALKAEMWLVKQSARELMEIIDKHKFKTVLLPLPGCYNGELKWEDVGKELELILDHRVFMVRRKGENVR